MSAVDAVRAAELVAPDGTRSTRLLTPDQQVALYARTLHRGAGGYVELAAARRLPDGGLRFRAGRRDPASYPPAGDVGRLVELARCHREQGLELFATPLTRSAPVAGKSRVRPGRVIWVDVDNVADPAELPWVGALRPHLRVASGGGQHAYWLLERALPCGEIESLNRRLAAALGGDLASCDRGRIMRLPGSVNRRRGRLARIVALDLSRPPVDPDRLRAKLSDPQLPAPPLDAARLARHHAYLAADAAAHIPPPAYFAALAGIEVPERGGFVRCPVHEEEAASCLVYPTPERGWHCYGCLRGGSIYDLASALEGGPTGRALRGERFNEVRRRVHERLGLRPGALAGTAGGLSRRAAPARSS